jgi:hypothetical protein
MKKAADKYIQRIRAREFVKMLQEVPEYIRQDLDFTVVPFGNGILIFNRDPKQVLDIFNGIRENIGKGKPLSRSKLVNKCVEILKKIDEYVDVANEVSKYPKIPPAVSYTLKHPELRTITQVKEYVENPKVDNNRWRLRDILRKCNRELFSKPGLKDEHISEAMDLVVMARIMKQ